MLKDNKYIRGNIRVTFIGIYIICMGIQIEGNIQEPNNHFLNIHLKYPLSLFSSIEHCCRELWSDLDVLYQENEIGILQKLVEHIENSFFHLEARINILMASDEAAIYLPEDIAYLLEVVTRIEAKVMFLYAHKVYSSEYQSIEGVVHHAKEILAKLLHDNKECTEP